MEFYKIRTKDKVKTNQSRRIWRIYWTRDFADFRALRTHRII